MISLLVPSRGRERQFWQMAWTAFEQADGRVEIVVRLDDDDSPYEMRSEFDGHGHMRVKPIIGGRTVLSSLWNECAAEASGEILMQCADDIRFRTLGWDTLVTDAFDQYPDRIVYVYGRDGIADERMATHGFMHRRWYELLGYFTWPAFSSDYGDLWNHTIAERLDRLHFIPEVYTEHLHPSVGKAELDQTHLDRIGRDETDENWRRWENAQGDLNRAVELLRGEIGRVGGAAPLPGLE